MTFKPWHWFVYIALCKDGTYYTGMTWDLSKRDEQHKTGKGSAYTAKHGYIRVVYYEEFGDFNKARNRERQLKKWSQEKKRKLIGDWWAKDWDE